MRASTFILTLLALLACLSSLHAEDYVIKAGDTLSITVVGEPDLTKKVIVDSQGSVSLALIKPVQVAGLTAGKAAEKLTSALKQFIKDPQLTIDLIEPAKIRVSISGEVGNAGVVTVPQGARLMEAITSAGGYSSNADLAKVSLTHAGDSQAAIVDLSAYLLGGKISENAELADGDVIVIPSKTLPSVGKISVLGAVRQPGQFEISQGTTIREAVMLAGGPTELADANQCTLRRSGSADSIPIDYALAMQGNQSANIALKPGDVIYVGTSQQLGFYTIQGGVNAAGRYEMKGRTTITEAIAIAGGVRDRAKLSDVRILRTSDQGTKTLVVNVSDVMSGKTDNIPLQDRDSIYVPQGKEKTNAMQWVSLAVSLGWLLSRR